MLNVLVTKAIKRLISHTNTCLIKNNACIVRIYEGMKKLDIGLNLLIKFTYPSLMFNVIPMDLGLSL